ACALVEALRRLPGAEPLIHLELARLHLACDRPHAALAHAQRALACRHEGGFPEGLRLAAALAERLGRPDDVARYLEQLGRLVPDDAALPPQRPSRPAPPVPGATVPPAPPLPPGRGAAARLNCAASAAGIPTTGHAARAAADAGTRGGSATSGA